MVKAQKKGQGQSRVQVKARRGGRGKIYAIAAGIAVLFAVAVFANRGGPRPNDFPVAANLATQPRIEAEGYLMGNPDAPVQVMEWADFECGACMQFATVTKPDVQRRLVETGQVAVRFFFFPLPMHRSAASAAYAAACAGDQQRFWEMHDAIFNGYNDWANGRARDPKGVFRGYAQRIGLDAAAWEECYESDRHRELIASHVNAGAQRGVNSTPTFFFGDRMVSGAIGYDEFRRHADEVLASLPPAPAMPADSPTDVPAGRPVPTAADTTAR